MQRHLALRSRRPLATAASILFLMSVLGTTIGSAQSGAGQPPAAPVPTCDPWEIDPCPTAPATKPPLSGSFTWTHLSVGEGGLGGTVQWDSTVTLELAWMAAERLYVPLVGTYSYSQRDTSTYCSGSVAGSGSLAKEPFAVAGPGVATVTGDGSSVVSDALIMSITIWRDPYTVHCRQQGPFPPHDVEFPGNGQHPYCTRVLATPDAPGSHSYALSCVSQEIEGLDVVVSGTLVGS